MAIVVEPKALTAEEADAHAARNQRQSPLLRLPGELRNRIYEYALSGITVSVFPSLETCRRYQLYAHLGSAATCLVLPSKVLDVIGLTSVCRQVYAEACLLPFRSIAFHIHSDGSFAVFIKTLSDTQRNAIATVQISTPDAYWGGKLWHSVTYFPGNDIGAQRDHLDLLEWSSELAFDQLAGLKRVVVEKDQQWVYNEPDNRIFRDGISSCVKGRDVEIVIPPSNA